MIALLFQLAGSGQAPRLTDAEASVFGLPSAYIGYVVLALIVIPVIFLVSSAVFGAPRNMKVPGLFMVCLGVLVSATVVGFALIGSLLGFVFPQ